MVERQPLTVGPALTFMFEEENWITKFGILCLILLIGPFLLVIPLFLIPGYVIEIMRRKSRGQLPLLPAWDNWSKFLKDGVIVTAAQVIYTLPLTLVICCAAFTLIAGSDSDTGVTSGPAVLVALCGGCIGLLAMIPLAVLSVAGTVRFAETGRFNSFFAFSEMHLLKSENRSQLITAVLSYVGISLVGGFIPYLGTAWAYMASGHLLGQLMRPTETVVNAGPQMTSTF